MTTRIITFRTNDPVYEYCAKMLGASLDRLSMPHECYVLDKFAGDWCGANHYRVQFLLDRLDEHRGGVFWIDADTIVWEDFRPLLAELERDGVDFAGHWLDKETVFGSCLYFGDTSNARRLIGLWRSYLPDLSRVASRLHHVYGNQAPLSKAVGVIETITSAQWKIKMRNLPREMAFWTDLRSHPSTPELANYHPAIECFQVSGMLKDPRWIASTGERTAQAVLYRESRRRYCATIQGVERNSAWKRTIAALTSRFRSSRSSDRSSSSTRTS